MILSGQVHAWGNLGHQTICEMALAELTPTARAEVNRLIELDTRFESFAESCTYADWPRRQRRAGHFLKLPRSAAAVATDDCPLTVDCLFRAAEDDLTILRDDTQPDAARLKSLKLLGHWVGDFHQPLHVSFADDRGGNEVLEQGGPCEYNVHSAWDTCIIKEKIGADYTQNAEVLRSEISNGNREHWKFDSPVEWANESFQITTMESVEYCVKQQGACWYSEDNMILQDEEPRRRVTVDQAYMGAHVEAIKLRLKQSAIRLAAVLNAALD
jgi:hypothetical protein